MKKALAILGTWALALGSLVAITSQGGSAQGGAFDPPNNFSGYSTGTDVFANALKNFQPGTELTNANVGFSGAASNSTGLLTPYVAAGATPPPPHQGLTGPFENEMGNAVVEAYTDRTRDTLTNRGKIHLMALWFHAFFDSLGPYGQFNRHYLHDAAAFEGALGAGLLLAVRRPAWRAPLLVLAALHFAFHAISHGVDVTRADPEWVGPVEFAGLLGGAALLLLLARRALAESGDPRGRGSA